MPIRKTDPPTQCGFACSSKAYALDERHYDRASKDLANEQQLGGQDMDPEKGSASQKDRPSSSPRIEREQDALSRADTIAKEVQITVEACKDSQETSKQQVLHPRAETSS